MKTIFKTLLLILITSLAAQSQNKHILSEVLKTSSNSELKLNLNNAFVQLEQSPDDNIYLDYSMEFKNYEVDEFESIIKGISTNLEQKGSNYILTLDSKHAMSSVVFSLESSYGISLDNAFATGEASNRKIKKSKDALIKMMSWDDAKAEVFLETLKKYKADGTTEPIDLNEVKSYSVKCIVKVPQRVKLNLQLKQSEVQFRYDAYNEIRCEGEQTTIRGQKFINEKSKFQLNGGMFKVHVLSGGDFMFKDLNKVMIAEMDNVSIDSEFSDFSIGEVGSSVKITDFNSEFWLYNFDANMGTFNMDTEYSKINLYVTFSSDNIAITTFGYGTVHYMNNLKTEIPPSRNKTSSKMMVIGDDNASTKNKIRLNSINGIIRIGEDFIDFSN
ncbi:hypothetical protein [Psychroserpens sp.]|uniref:hypothetical protein n=1 Tax=Psychroserpens sp. TaxID=2020870 RepID=UPI001B1284B7|nr:hypothetical protein [Psychroserpens sp.]MBO6606868.1 hypothetical protein [Psychroserpens sp.]MBO6654014.1 hypothetical protein [Psychroserpens sp.]MBO6682700.1 hypothetical protein [Psychroserpens sp.]MBO6750640.1 hypothetical protein [Psychroserpens sp.]MBO6915931.1 hypothetical protein [Psychroserpens sp.]